MKLKLRPVVIKLNHIQVNSLVEWCTVFWSKKLEQPQTPITKWEIEAVWVNFDKKVLMIIYIFVNWHFSLGQDWQLFLGLKQGKIAICHKNMTTVKAI